MLQFIKTLAFIQQVQVIELALCESIVKRLNKVRHRIWHLNCVLGVHVLNRSDEVDEQTA